MNQSILFRLSAAAFAAITLLPAQSAPVARSNRAQGTEAASQERMQVRLAEVIAMLEEDDLTTEQRASAKKKLQEIVAALRRSRATTAEAPQPADVPARTARARSDAPSEATPAPSPLRVRSRVSHDESESMAAPVPAEPPKAPKPAKAPKAPKAQKAPAVVVEVEPSEGANKHSNPMVLRWSNGKGEATGETNPTVQWRYPKAGEFTHESPEGVQILRSKSGGLTTRLQDLTGEQRALIAKGQQLGEAGRIYVHEGEEWRELAQKIKEQQAKGEHDIHVQIAEQAEGAKALRGRLLDVERAAVRARTEADRSRAQAERSAARDVARTRDVARARKVEVEHEAQHEHEAEHEAEHERQVRHEHDAQHEHDADNDIREMIESMRKEMREIRALMQQMRERVGVGQGVRSRSGSGFGAGPGGAAGGGNGGVFGVSPAGVGGGSGVFSGSPGTLFVSGQKARAAKQDDDDMR